jgi:hypothetical protein
VRTRGAHPGALAAPAALAVSLLPYVFFLAVLPATADQDAALHAIYALFPKDPSRVLSVWARPAFAVPYLLPAHLGYLAMRVTTVLLCAITAWLVYRLAARLQLRWAWLAIPLVLLQPVLLPVGMDTMTEPTFQLILAAGLLALAHERRVLAAVLLSFLPLARPEGPFVLAVIAIAWLPRAFRDARQWIPIALLATGMVLWELSVIVITQEPHFLQKTFPWPSAGAAHVVNPPMHYVRRWSHIIGIGTLPLWLLGLWASRRRPFVLLLVAMTAFVFAIHSYLFATGSLASTGFDRYFAALAPLTAIIALAGLDSLSVRAPRAALGAAVALLVLDAGQGMIALDSNPYNHMPAATLAMTRRVAPQLRADAHVLSADHFGYVFLGVDDIHELPVGAPASAAAAIDTLPTGTIVLWDNVTGDWWYHLAATDFTARRYRVLSTRHFTLQSPLGAYYYRAATSHLGWFYYCVGEWPVADVQQTLLVRD